MRQRGEMLMGCPTPDLGSTSESFMMISTRMLALRMLSISSHRPLRCNGLNWLGLAQESEPKVTVVTRYIWSQTRLVDALHHEVVQLAG